MISSKMKWATDVIAWFKDGGISLGVAAAAWLYVNTDREGLSAVYHFARNKKMTNLDATAVQDIVEQYTAARKAFTLFQEQ